MCVTTAFIMQNSDPPRGVRQGHPLSPLLLIMAQQIMSFNRNKKQEVGDICPYKLGRNVAPISHLFYADDMLIFTNGSIRSLRCLQNLMQQYEEASGQTINLQKSAIYSSKLIFPGRLGRIQNLSGCQVKKLPFKYLGAPIYKGRCRCQLFADLVETFAAKICVESFYDASCQCFHVEGAT